LAIKESCYEVAMINYVKIVIFYNVNVEFIKIVTIDDFWDWNHIKYKKYVNFFFKFFKM